MIEIILKIGDKKNKKTTRLIFLVKKVVFLSIEAVRLKINLN
jgi:hypothetical protein